MYIKVEGVKGKFIGEKRKFRNMRELFRKKTRNGQASALINQSSEKLY